MTSDLPQKTILRIFQAIRYLATPPHKTVLQLAAWLEVDKRSVYRYFKLLEEIGYDLDKDFDGRYFIAEADPRTPNQFTAEESQLVKQLLGALPDSHPLAASIRRKVYLTSELTPLTDELIDLHRARIVQRLAEAIAERKQVRLINYHSVNSDQISDRIVEPQKFSDDYSQLDAYELTGQRVKTFKIQRMHDVEILTQAAIQEADQELPTDAFGFKGEAFSVLLLLSRRAYRLLIEEFPSLLPYTHPHQNARFPYRFVGEARSTIGIGRFILGLPSEIEVEGPPLLKEYLNKRVAGVKW